MTPTVPFNKFSWMRITKLGGMVANDQRNIIAKNKETCKQKSGLPNFEMMLTYANLYLFFPL